MTDAEARAVLSRGFHALFDPAVSGKELAAFFAPDYRQSVDAKLLGRAAFIDHANVLKRTLAGGAEDRDLGSRTSG
jgi:hypothetical protein